jgi:hypothetical protein
MLELQNERSNKKKTLDLVFLIERRLVYPFPSESLVFVGLEVMYTLLKLI